VLIYENTLGNPLMKPGDAGLGWKPDHAMNVIIRPTVNVLLDLRDRDVFHGNIRPANMFDGGAKVLERIILGDCLAVPPSYTQSAVFEPVERAMADPIARGRGGYEDDLYAFGVSLAVILRHRDPLEGMTDEEIIKTKMEIGSYAALTGNERFTGAILELLRGLLYDERDQRWTLEEIMSWLDGQRLSPKQSARKIKAARHLTFAGEKYFRPQLLAMDLNKAQAEAVQLIENDTLGQWVERSLEDKQATQRLAVAIDAARESGRGPGYWDRLLARVSIALDVTAPLRFRGMNLNPDGISYAMAEAAARKKDMQPYLDIINQQLVMFWVTNQTDNNVDIGALLGKYDACRSFLRQPSIGYGVERCLYTLCPEAPCISETLKGYYVRSPEDFVYVLEDISTKPNRPHLFIDRHVAAFLSVKDRKVIDPFLVELNAPDFYRRVMGNLMVVATIQKRSRLDDLPGLGAWAMDILKPIYERYHDRELREKIREKITKLAATGDLNRMAAVLDDQMVRQQDMLGFKAAMREHSELRKELTQLEADLEHPNTYGREAGHQYAAIASAIIAGIVILAVAFIYLTHAGALKGM
jgi:hypothetical protein